MQLTRIKNFDKGFSDGKSMVILSKNYHGSANLQRTLLVYTPVLIVPTE